jgi:cytochrome c-type biogenesis protein CcmH/NrfG
MLQDDRFETKENATAAAQAVRRRRRATAVAHLDNWAPFAAHVTLAIVVAGGLLVLTAQYRNGGVADHEIQRDHTTAIQNLFFRN